MNQGKIGTCLKCGEIICDTQGMDLVRENNRLRRALEEIHSGVKPGIDLSCSLDKYQIMDIAREALEDAPQGVKALEGWR